MLNVTDWQGYSLVFLRSPPVARCGSYRQQNNKGANKTEIKPSRGQLIMGMLQKHLDPLCKSNQNSCTVFWGNFTTGIPFFSPKLPLDMFAIVYISFPMEVGEALNPARQPSGRPHIPSCILVYGNWRLAQVTPTVARRKLQICCQCHQLMCSWISAEPRRALFLC